MLRGLFGGVVAALEVGDGRFELSLRMSIAPQFDRCRRMRFHHPTICTPMPRGTYAEPATKLN
jgi:hypothetical protein